MSKYDDIIDTKYPFGLGHPRMSMHDRAAQFAPFAALTGYEEAIEETARQTDDLIMLDEEGIRELNEKLAYINNNLNKNIEVNIEYFVKDEKKQGGCYKMIKGIVKRIDEVEKILIFKDKTKIPLKYIYHIEII